MSGEAGLLQALWAGLGFQPVWLISDLLLFGLLAVLGGLAWRARGHLPTREGWRRVMARPAAMSSLVVLAAFLGIALLDSLHYRKALPPTAGQTGVVWSVEVKSVLDAALAPLAAATEKTYSAPFAYRSLARETVQQPDGSQIREYPRLRHGGAHLDDPETQRAGDIARRVLVATLACCLGFGVLLYGLARLAGGPGGPARLLAGDMQLAWRSAALSAGGVLWLLALGVALSPEYHLFGTDKVGQDVLYLTLKSVRTAMLIGTLTTLVMLPLALALGILAGYLGGWVDDLIQYVYTVLNSIPGVLLIAAAVLMMQVLIDTHPQWFATAAERADARLVALCAILGLTSWTGLCRLLRAETLKLRALEYVQAARAFGVGTPRILIAHILPNLMHIVLINVAMDFSGLVLAEAVLSYVGIGVDPSTASLGTMINNARMELAREPMVWWSLSAAFCTMLAMVLAANLLADALREAFDPRAA